MFLFRRIPVIFHSQCNCSATFRLVALLKKQAPLVELYFFEVALQYLVGRTCQEITCVLVLVDIDSDAH